MDIAIVGTGYVGLVSGTCFAEMGVNVTCVDVDTSKIEKLKQGIIPIYEPGLEDMVHKNVEAGRLHFVTDLASVLDEVDVVFSAVGTPPDEDGSADLKYVLEVARTIGRNMNKYLVVVTKSTVPVGTAQKVKTTIRAELDKRGVNIDFDVASNPEFLKEGAAIKDFMSPDRVVVGVESNRSREIMARLYKPFMLSSDRIIFTDIPSAEMIKYAANSMLATRISFMNDIANLCEIVGADVNMVRKGIGSDTRIGKKFLYPGCGYGGSCFPKDVKALIKTAEQKEAEVENTENKQKEEAKPAKRRGRPRKNPTETLVTKVEAAAPKKRRGRPRKNAEIITSTVTEEVSSIPVQTETTAKAAVPAMPKEQEAEINERPITALVKAINRLTRQVDSLKRLVAGKKKVNY